MKKIVGIIIFLLITLIIFIKYEAIIRSKMFSHNDILYYNQKQNIDVFFLGSSRIQWSMSPMEIWQKYGIISYNRGTAAQYYKLSYLFLEDIYRNYHPKLVIVDTSFLETLDFFSHNRTDITLANLKNNIHKFYAYKYIYNNINEVFIHGNTLARFHERWKDITIFDFTNENFWKGRFAGTYVDDVWRNIHLVSPVKKYENSNITPIPLADETKKYANMMVEIAKKNNSEILFIKMPYVTNDKELGLDVSFQEFCKQNNYNFINYNLLYNDLKFDFNKHMRDKSHLNLYGSRKVMDHLIPYIIEHYNIPNRKNDPAYASWNEDYLKYARAINREEIRELKSFTDWKKQAFYDNYTVMISINGDVLRKLPYTLKNDLKSFGLKKYNTNKANMRYAAIIDDNKVFFEEISNKPVTYKGRMKNIVNLLVSSDGKATINVSGKPRSKNKYGLNFVIYDKVNREIVDSIWIDPNKPNEVRR